MNTILTKQKAYVNDKDILAYGVKPELKPELKPKKFIPDVMKKARRTSNNAYQ
jgi:hypothetical protein